jgi:hypothetical protein
MFCGRLTEPDTNTSTGTIKCSTIRIAVNTLAKASVWSLTCYRRNSKGQDVDWESAILSRRLEGIWPEDSVLGEVELLQSVHRCALLPRGTNAAEHSVLDFGYRGTILARVLGQCRDSCGEGEGKSADIDSAHGCGDSEKECRWILVLKVTEVIENARGLYVVANRLEQRIV